jgi:hypothetical protein
LFSQCARNAHRDAEGKRGYCSMHYQRLQRHRDPSVVKATPSPAKDWLRDHVGHDGDDCLIWPFANGADGYGRVHRPNDGPLTTAANVMCELAHGPRPSPLHESAHSCGRGSDGCVNPRHLRWATPTENHADKVEHGTTNRGERQGRHKLTETDVLEIRASHEPQSVLAARYGVDPSTISNVQTGRTWGWL